MEMSYEELINYYKSANEQLSNIEIENKNLKTEKLKLEDDKKKIEDEKEELTRIYKEELLRMQEEYELSRTRQFIARSEAFDRLFDKSPGLFNELEAYRDEPEPEIEENNETIVKSHKRKKGRKKAPEHLKRVTTVIDIPEEEKECQCGNRLKEIGSVVTERIAVIPAVYYVEETVRKKYVCDCCSKNPEAGKVTMKTATLPPELLPKIKFSYSMLAYLIASKFIDGIPFYRLNKILKRYGCEIRRSVMSRYGMSVADKLKDLYEMMKSDLQTCRIVGIDETRLKVLKEPDRPKGCHSYMWVFRGADIDRKILLFNYNPSRSSKVPFDIMNGYKGVIQTDGYAGYNKLAKSPDIKHAGCWVHVRRKFKEVLEVSKDAKGALIIFNKINELYRIEKEISELELEGQDVVEMRLQKSKPVIDYIENWVTKKIDHIPPKSLLGKAIHYMNSQFDKLRVYLYFSELTPDNNLVENVIRPFVVGRKSWLFSGSPAGADSSSILYSLIETANANGLEPYWYLRFVFEKYPYAVSDDDKRRLLAYNVDKDDFAKFKADRCSL
jgi:transposase